MRPSNTALLFGFSFLTASSYVLAQALAVSLFLARVGPDELPTALAVAAVAVIGISFVTRYLLGRVRTMRLALGSWFLLGLASLACTVLLRELGRSALLIGELYVLAEVRGCLNTIYGVTFCNDAFAKQDSKRPFAIVASGAPCAGILVGVVLGVEADVASPTLILSAILAIDLLTVGLLWFIRNRLSERHDVRTRIQRAARVRMRKKARTRRSVPRFYGFNLAALVAVKIVVLTLIGYQWKVALAGYFRYDEQSLVAYLAIFYAASDVAILLLQWLAAGQILDRFGLKPALLGYPLCLTIVGVAAFFPTSPFALMAVFTAGRGLHVLRRAVHDPALAVAYSVFDRKSRRETIVFVTGIVKPFAEVATVLVLLFVGSEHALTTLTIIWLVLIAPWITFALRTARGYQTVPPREPAADAEAPAEDSVSHNGGISGSCDPQIQH